MTAFRRAVRSAFAASARDGVRGLGCGRGAACRVREDPAARALLADAVAVIGPLGADAELAMAGAATAIRQCRARRSPDPSPVTLLGDRPCSAKGCRC